jgi:hypothetical protein
MFHSAKSYARTSARLFDFTVYEEARIWFCSALATPPEIPLGRLYEGAGFGRSTALATTQCARRAAVNAQIAHNTTLF